MSARFNSTDSSNGDATLLEHGIVRIESEAKVFVISRSGVRFPTVASLSSQQHNNSYYTPFGRGQLFLFPFAVPIITTTKIDSIDNKNFVAGFLVVQHLIVYSAVERPAAVKLVTGVAAMQDSPSGIPMRLCGSPGTISDASEATPTPMGCSRSAYRHPHGGNSPPSVTIQISHPRQPFAEQRSGLSGGP